MGCAAGSGQVSGKTARSSPMHKYTVIVIPPSFDNQVDFVLESIYSSIPLSTLMNLISYDYGHSKVFDSNFISVYDPVLEDYKYYVQRLIGYEIENEEHPEDGKMWVPYINNEKQDWHLICDHDTEVTPKDTIEWKFQKVTEVHLSPAKA